MTHGVVADPPQSLDMLWHELGSILVEQQQSLDKLLFRLDQEHLILVTGRNRWLSKATDEVLAVGAELAEQETRRRTAVDRITISLDLRSHPTLSELAERAPEGWAGVMRRHCELMRSGVRDVQAMATRNRAVVAERLNASGALLKRMGSVSTETYNRDANLTSQRVTGRHVWGAM